MKKVNKNNNSKDLEKQGMFKRPIRVNDLRTARRLMSRTILSFQNNEISDTQAKTLCYLTQNFANLMRISTFEDRIIELEKLLGSILHEE